MNMETVRHGELIWQRDPEIAVPHCFTTRPGGVSTAPHLRSLNLGTKRGDLPENVLKNYEILGQAAGFDPHRLVLTTQVHSDIVLAVDDKNAGAGLYAPPLPECDGLVTCTPGLGLVCFTADCTPVLLWDPETGAVGAVHAGWRGTALKIAGITAEKMVKTYGCKRENIRAAIGPHIGKCCFETDADVPDAMRRSYGEKAEKTISRQGEKYRVDLTALNTMALREAGVIRISASCLCTRCEEDLFWSHRRMGDRWGSQCGIIVCQGGEK